MSKKIFPYLIFFFIGVCAQAQIGGASTYQFLHLPNSARVNAMGGKVVSITDGDLSMSYQNPATLNIEMNKNLFFNYGNYIMDIGYGYFSYAKSMDTVNNFAVGVFYLDYGDFIEADASGEILGSFTAKEYAVNLIYSRKLNQNFNLGVNLKPVLSYLESYSSFGMAMDLGVYYKHLDEQLSSGMVFRNIGTQIKPYTEGNFESLPFEILIGASYKLKHAPFRFTLTAHQLQKPDLTYTIPEEQSQKINESTTAQPLKANYAPTIKSNSALMMTELGNAFTGLVNDYSDVFMRHIIFNTDIILTKNFYVTAGYNYQRRQELKLPSRTSVVGFSWGFGLKISRLQFSYGSASYHLAGSTNMFSLSINLSESHKKQALVKN